MLSKKSLERNIYLYYTVDFLTALIFIIPVWVAFERRILNFTEMALFTAISAGVALVLEVPTGALADMLGRKVTMMFGWALNGIGFVIEAFAPNPATFLFAFVIMGIGTAFVSGADVALMYDTLKALGKEDDFSRFMSRSKLLYRIGLATATFAGGFLYAVNIRLPLLLITVTNFFAIPFIAAMVEPHIEREKFHLASYKRQIAQGFREITKNAAMKKLALYYTLVGGITWSCLNYFNLPFMKSVGYSEQALSIIIGSSYIISALMIFFLAESKSLLTRNRVYLLFPFVMTIGFLPGVFANRLTAPILLVIIMFAGSARFTFLDRYTNGEFSSQYRATALSVLNMLVSIFYILIVSVSGVVQDLYGTKIIYTGLGLLSLLLVLPSAIGLVNHRRASLKSQTPIPQPTEEQAVG